MIWLYSVVSNEVVAHKSSLVTLVNNSSTLNFRPGQYVYVSADIQKGVKRPYSIMSSPKDSHIQLLIKYFDNYQQAGLWVPGGTVYVDGPYGNLSYENVPEHNQLWLAGGAGIAPFISMARSLKTTEKRVVLHWFVNETYQLDAVQDLISIAEKLGPDTLTIQTHTKHGGNWKFDEMIRQNKGLSAILVSGSPRMKNAVADAVVRNRHKATVLWDVEGDTLRADTV